MAIVACDTSTHDDSMARHGSPYSELDDSIAAMSPEAPAMLAAAMRTASDSLEYYELYFRKLRINVTSGNIHPDSLDWTPVEKFLDNARPSERINSLKGVIYNLKGYSYLKYGCDPHTTISFYKKAYDALAKSDNLAKLPDVCANIGDIYINLNDMPAGAQWYRRALFLSDSLHLPEADRISLHMGLARIYQNIGDTDSADKGYRRVKEHLDELPLNMQIYFLNNYGNFLYFSGKYREAETTFNYLKRLLIDNGMENEVDMQVCKINLADIYLNLGEPDKARENLADPESFFKATGNSIGIYYANTIRIGLALLDNNVDEARKVMESEKIDAPIDYNLVNIRHGYRIKYYEKNGDYRNAYNELLAQKAYHDSLGHNITRMHASDIMARYTQDTLALHHRIAMQEKDNVIYHSRLMVTGSVVTIIILILLSLYLITLNRKRRLQTDMQLMRIKLAGIRNLISPHFTFNVLNHRIAKAREGDERELTALVKLIRENIRMSGHLFVTLEKEMDFVRRYLDVVYHEVKDISIDMKLPDEDDLKRLYIPSTFIQILVENALKHGFHDKNDEKRLSITITTGTEFYTVDVTDNGAGFDIRHNNTEDSAGTGLRLIRSTIAVVNRENKHKITFTISNITSPVDGSCTGCRASLIIPVDAGRNQENALF